MAERRMFSKNIIDSDAFLEMPQSTQLYYFHLSMRADDDGFVNKPKSIMMICGAKEDDFKLLIVKRFIIPYESGIVVIKHWRMHNYIQKDRYIETKYKDEKALLVLDENKAYTPAESACIQNGYIMDTQVRLGKVNIGKVNSKDINIKEGVIGGEKVADAPVCKKFTKPALEEISAYCKERDNGIDSNAFYDFYESKGWLIGKTPMKDWKAAVRTWEQRNPKPKKEDKPSVKYTQGHYL